MKQCYIWTALTQRIKPVAGWTPVGLDILGCCVNADNYRGTPHPHTGYVVEGGGSLFWTHARTDSDAKISF